MIEADPDEVGLSAERLARVDALTHGYVDEGRFPGVVTVIARQGTVVHHDTYGFADVDERRPLEPEAIFRIYSMTKPVASLALMQLYEEGRVLLENPVARFLPAFADAPVWDGGTADEWTTRPTGRPITVHDVLTHQAGFTAGFQFRHPVDELYRRRGLGGLDRPDVPLAEGMEVLASLPLLFSPGEGWAYGMSTDVVGAIVEAVTGQSLDVVLAERIFEPLGMVDTAFWVPPEQLHRLASNYGRGRDRRLRRIDHRERTHYAARPAYLSGAGGLVSTAADYQRFVQMLANGGELDGRRIIGPRTLAYMATNHLPDGATLNERGQDTFSEAAMAGTGFGLGFSVVVDAAAAQSLVSVGEYGWGGAASTVFWVDPAEELTVLFLTQLIPSNLYPIRRQLRAAVNQAIVR